MSKKLFTLLDLCVSSLRRGHANLLCIVPILTDDPRRESDRHFDDVQKVLVRKPLVCNRKDVFCPTSYYEFFHAFIGYQLLVVARKLTTSREMLLWMTPSEAPKALQASECSELLDPMRASCWISAQH